jgi:hypothetical protein
MSSYYSQIGHSHGHTLQVTIPDFVALCNLAKEQNKTLWLLGRDMEPYYFVAKALGYENKNVRYLAGLNRDCTSQMQPQDMLDYLQKIGVRYWKDYFIDSGFHGSIFQRIATALQKNKNVRKFDKHEFYTRCYLVSAGYNCLCQFLTQYETGEEGRHVYQAVMDMEEAPKRETVHFSWDKKCPVVTRSTKYKEATEYTKAFVESILEGRV